MAGSLNKVQLIGRLGADPEIKQMVNGKSVARLSLATSQNWKDKNTTDEWKSQNLLVIKSRMKGWQLESFIKSYKCKVEEGISLYKKNLLKK